MPRITKKSSASAKTSTSTLTSTSTSISTPRRATRSSVRAGSASLETTALETTTTSRRRGRSQSVTSNQSQSSVPETYAESDYIQRDNLPTLPEEEEKQQSSPLVIPEPIDFAPIVDASPYMTPARPVIASPSPSPSETPSHSPTRTSSQSPSQSPSQPVASIVDDARDTVYAHAEYDDKHEDEYEDPVQAQIAAEQEHAGLSHLPSSSSSSSHLKRKRASGRMSSSSAVITIHVDDDCVSPTPVPQTPHVTNGGDVSPFSVHNNSPLFSGRVASSNQRVSAGGSPSSPAVHTPHVKSNKPSPTSAVHTRQIKSNNASPTTQVSAGVVATPAFAPRTTAQSAEVTRALLSPEHARQTSYKTSVAQTLKPLSPNPVLTPSPPKPTITVLDQFVSSPRLMYELTTVDRTALMFDMRKEIMRLRKVEAEYMAGGQPPRQDPSPEIIRSVARRRDLRFQLSIAKPAAEAHAAALAAQAAAAAEAAAQAAAQAASQPQPEPESTPSRSNPNSSEKRRKTKTPQRSSKPASPAETPVAAAAAAASPSWGIGSIFGSVKSIFGNRSSNSMSPVKQLQTQTQTSPSQQENPIQAKSPISPSPATPTPKESVSDTPVRTTRRRGVLPGSARAPRNRNTPRKKPKEPNADRRAQNLEQAADQAAERKRIQNQADKIEQERVKAEQEQKKHEEEEVARQQAGSKRKRVRIDDLKVIPAHRPGEGSGTFGLVDEFFDQNSDDEDDYVEMDIDDIELMSSPRPTKKARLDENVFQPKASTTQPLPSSPAPQMEQSLFMPATPMPATPAPNYSQHTQQAIEKQRLQLSQHKPKRPSRLREEQRLSTGSNRASSPLQPATVQPATANVAKRRPSTIAETPEPKHAMSPLKLVAPLEVATPLEVAAPLEEDTPLPQSVVGFLDFEWPPTVPMGPDWVWERINRLAPVETEEEKAGAAREYAEEFAERQRKVATGLIPKGPRRRFIKPLVYHD